jgi:hypothetical protein
MNNEEALASFCDYLEQNKFLARDDGPEILKIIEAFARAIDPVRLCEATVAEMKVFVSDNRQPARDSWNPRTRAIGQQIAFLQHYPYKMALLAFRGWRNALKKRT